VGSILVSLDVNLVGRDNFGQFSTS